MGSRLARRIVLPLLGLVGALFALLAAAGVLIADHRIEQELSGLADRVARTLDENPAGSAAAILPSLAELVGVEIIVKDPSGVHATRDWPAASLRSLAPGEAELQGVAYRVVERAGRGGRRYLVLTERDQLAQRRRDVLLPVVAMGAVGLIVAALLGIGVARTIARPVKALAETAARYAAGERDGEVPRNGPGEIGDLEAALAKMLAAVRDSEKRLRESERFAALGRLAGGIAHELRNPLTAIRMAVETGLGDGSSSSRGEAREIALGEIDRLDRTLTELLEYVRPREPRPVKIDVRELFDECIQLLGPQCAHLKIDLETDVPDQAVFVSADRDRLKQALLNLVLNGAQAQPHGGRVCLRARKGEIAVSDRGAGIPDEVRDEIFQPFVTTKSAGIGLGLAVVKQVADEHEAVLDVETGPGGTTFILRFSA